MANYGMFSGLNQGLQSGLQIGMQRRQMQEARIQREAQAKLAAEKAAKEDKIRENDQIIKNIEQGGKLYKHPSVRKSKSLRKQLGRANINNINRFIEASGGTPLEHDGEISEQDDMYIERMADVVNGFVKGDIKYDELPMLIQGVQQDVIDYAESPAAAKALTEMQSQQASNQAMSILEQRPELGGTKRAGLENLVNLMDYEGVGQKMQAENKSRITGELLSSYNEPTVGAQDKAMIMRELEKNSPEMALKIKDRELAQENRLRPYEKLKPEAIMTMRKEFETNQITKDYVLVKQQENKMKAAYKMIGKNNVVVDQVLITMLNKMIDPPSVVRESEYNRTPENLSFVNRVLGSIQKFGTGGAGLTDEDRKAVLDLAMRFATDTEKYYQELEDNYREIANFYEVPERLVITTPKFGRKAPTSTPSTKTEPTPKSKKLTWNPNTGAFE